jgi:hypothetical protein
VGAGASFHRNKARLALGEKFSEPGTLDCATLYLAGVHIDDMELEHGLGQIETNDREICGRLHDGASGLSGRDTFHSGTLMPLPRGPIRFRIGPRQHRA